MKSRRSSIRGRLIIISLLLLVIPWLGYQYLIEMKDFLLTGQEKAQLLATQAIATVLHDRNDLFDPTEDIPASLIEQGSVYAYPLDVSIQIDGYLSDWEHLLPHANHYSEESIISVRNGNMTDLPEFSLLLGIQQRYIYGAIQVSDGTVIYRHPGYRRLDNGDHVRMSFIDAEEKIRRVVLVTEGPGTISAYEVDENWMFPLGGYPLGGIYGEWLEGPNGYVVEFRMKQELLGQDKRLRISVADVDDADSRQVNAEIGSLPSQWSNELNVLVVRSSKLENILRGLARSDAHIWVVDRHQRVRASVGGQSLYETDTIARLDERPVLEALNGSPVVRRIVDTNTGDEVIIAAQPILNKEQIIGAVVLMQNTTDILALQRKTFLQITLTTLTVLLVIILSLLGFASWLAWRIRRLSHEADTAIDSEGRVTATELRADRESRDELGQLSQRMSAMLQRLQRYTSFLENMPRTLRHEINNPLNVISTSLQNLTEKHPDLKDEQYLHSAERGIQRLSRIMDSLTEAASLEQSLQGDEKTRFDLALLVHTYVESCRHSHPQQRFDYTGPASGIELTGSALRIEQLLDKLVDNAIDFASPESPINIHLAMEGTQIILRVLNEGPLLPEELRGSTFMSMTSTRPSSDERPHLGMGLFIARTIAEYHGGQLQADNRADVTGVEIKLLLPGTT
ncbi:ATP-binding protein [Sulfuriflexus mobilis]|uniref:ATP-binding protein n=1 Tax=Sulfuriflexus mobilis TaxID=1811807 RepID=UPI000F82232F|nr:ATP-binding protein [Sulfuriflexus mobilis]